MNDINDDLVFAQFYQSSDLSEALDDSGGLLTEYERFCAEKAAESQGSESLKWKNESNTWRLTRMLLSRREQQMIDEDLPNMPLPNTPFKSDYLKSIEIMEDPILQENVLVKDWLQETAPEFVPCETRVGHLQFTIDSILRHGRDQKIGIQSSIPTVLELDPDATSRLQRTLVAEDQEFETQLNRTIFSYLRRGMMIEAIDLCKECNQHWKAATLMGGEFHSDKLLDNTEESTGNQNRSLWKAACYAMASDSSIESYERAVYGALAGDVQSVLHACQSWEDLLWAYFSAIIEGKFQSRLYSNNGHNLTKEIALPIPVVDISEEQVFDKLTTHENATIRQTASELFHLVQKHCILNSFSQLFKDIKRKMELFPSGQIKEIKLALRFLTHLVLLLRNLQLDNDQETTNYIIINYIQSLIENGYGELIAIYYEPLPLEIQISGYAGFLAEEINQKNIDEKAKYYRLGKQFRLKMDEICVRAVDLIIDGLINTPVSLHNIRTLVFVPIDTPVSIEDRQIITSLDWLTFEESQLKDLYDYCNVLLRQYLLAGKINCVKWIVERYTQVDDAFMVEGEEELSTEQLDYSTLITCFKLRKEWDLLQLQKPQSKLDTLEMLNWIDMSKEKTNSVSKLMLDLVQSRTFGSAFEFNLSSELVTIRAIYVPYLILSVHEMLYANYVEIPENLQKSFDLAQLVAKTGEINLATPFVDSNRMGALVDAMKQTAVASLCNSNSTTLPWTSQI